MKIIDEQYTFMFKSILQKGCTISPPVQIKIISKGPPATHIPINPSTVHANVDNMYILS